MTSHFGTNLFPAYPSDIPFEWTIITCAYKKGVYDDTNFDATLSVIMVDILVAHYVILKELV